MNRLTGRRTLVTGAASGIGREIARAFADEGARVALIDRDRAGLEATATAIDAPGIVADLAAPGGPAQAVRETADALGGIDILVNAAGILVRQPFESIAEDDWRRVFEVNLLGVAMLCRAALPALRESEGAAIVNIASFSALRPSAGTTAYAAIKAGVLMLGRCLAEEIAPIRVNTVCPGIVDTAMTQGFMADPAVREAVRTSNALQQVGQPADIAAACVYLASAEARYVTGAQIAIDGGAAYC